MTVIAIGEGVGRAELLAAVDEFAPSTWVRESVAFDWGSVSWAGDGVAFEGDFLVVGRPDAHPWGWPGSPLAPSELARRLAELGAPGIEAASGPRLAVDLRTRKPIVASNGLIPFFEASVEGRRIGSTSRAVAAGLVAGTVEVRQVFPHSAARMRDRRTTLDGRRVRNELMESAPAQRRGEDEVVLIPLSEDSLWGNGAQSVNRIRDLAEDVAAHYWWTARLRGQWLSCPPLERPTVDRLLEMST